MIYNKRFEIRYDKDAGLLDTILQFFKTNLKENELPLRWFIASINDLYIVVEASILEHNEATK